MRNGYSSLPTLLVLCGILVTAPLSAQDLRRHVVEYGSKRPLPGVMVQLYYNGHFTASARTDAKGRYAVLFPDGADIGEVALIVTRRPTTAEALFKHRKRNVLPAAILAYQGQLGFRTDNVLHADPIPARTRPRK